MMRFTNIGTRYIYVVNKLTSIFDNEDVSACMVVIYKALLDFIYYKYIAMSYSYFYISVSVLNIVNGWLLTIFASIFIYYYYKVECASSIVMVVLNIIYFIPITTYCGYGGGSSEFLFFSAIYWGILSFLQLKVPIVIIRESYFKDSNKMFIGLVILFSCFSIFVWGKYANFRIIFNIIDVYDIRTEAASYDIPIIVSYIRQFSTIIISMLMLLSMIKRKYLILIWLLFITWINFSFAGNKSIILFPIILIGGYIFYREKMLCCIIPGGILLEVIAIIENIVTGSSYIVSLFFRRTGLTLAQLSEYFFRFFNENTNNIFRDGIIGKLGFESIYSQTIANVIGNNFVNQTINCNNGLLADVWSGLGIIGIVVMPIILILCLRVFDLVSYNMESRVVISLAVYYAIVFANTTWSTVLITHGFIIMCVMLVFFPKTKKHGRTML